MVNHLLCGVFFPRLRKTNIKATMTIITKTIPTTNPINHGVSYHLVVLKYFDGSNEHPKVLELEL